MHGTHSKKILHPRKNAHAFKILPLPPAARHHPASLVPNQNCNKTLSLCHSTHIPVHLDRYRHPCFYLYSYYICRHLIATPHHTTPRRPQKQKHPLHLHHHFIYPPLKFSILFISMHTLCIKYLLSPPLTTTINYSRPQPPLSEETNPPYSPLPLFMPRRPSLQCCPSLEPPPSQTPHS